MGLDQYLEVRIPNAVPAHPKWSNVHEYEGQSHETGTYLGGWDHMPAEQTLAFFEIVDDLGLRACVPQWSPSMRVMPDGTVEMNVAYWRKANAIHGWFVENCQQGVDECQTSDAINPEQLAHLVHLCKRVVADPSLADELLPPSRGPLFGSYDIDEWYLNDLKETVEQIEKVLRVFIEAGLPAKGATIHYQSSW